MNDSTSFSLTSQELFNKAVLGVVNQGCLSKTDDSNSNVNCYYRHPQNQSIRCAIGHLIPDDRYGRHFEGKTAYFVIQGYLPEFLGQRFFLDNLQGVHDSSLNLGHFIDKARAFAVEHDLTFPEVNV